MSKPIIKIHNAVTGEIVEREMTEQEFAKYEIDMEQSRSEEMAKATKAAARQAILEKLGITEEEARLLLG